MPPCKEDEEDDVDDGVIVVDGDDDEEDICFDDGDVNSNVDLEGYGDGVTCVVCGGKGNRIAVYDGNAAVWTRDEDDDNADRGRILVGDDEGTRSVLGVSVVSFHAAVCC